MLPKNFDLTFVMNKGINRALPMVRRELTVFNSWSRVLVYEALNSTVMKCLCQPHSPQALPQVKNDRAMKEASLVET